MVTLDDYDAQWAWNLGLTYGAWYPNLDADLATIGREWMDYANPALNEAAAAHGRRRWGLHPEADLSPVHLTELLPYLQGLSQTASYAVEAAIYYRKDVVRTSWRGRDPKLEAPGPHTLPKFAAAVNGFLNVHPDLRFHFTTNTRPVNAPGTDRPAPPPPQPYGVSHAGAEHLVASWMQHLGAYDAQPTQVSGDGGIDVISTRYIAQVKNLAPTSAVPVSTIRDLAGVAAVDGRRAAMFTSGAYTEGGLAFANSAGIALFHYDAVRGTLVAANTLASGVQIEGMG